MTFPPVYELSEVAHPGEESLDLPTSLGASQGPSILCFQPIPTVWSDHLDAVLVLKPLVQPLSIVCLVANQLGRQFVEEAAAKDFFEKLVLCRRRALDSYGGHKTVFNGDNEDFCALAATGRAKGKAHSLRSQSLYHAIATPVIAGLDQPARPKPLTKPVIACPVQRVCSRILRHLAPIQNTQPSNARASCHGRSRRTAFEPQHRLNRLPLFVGQHPASFHLSRTGTLDQLQNDADLDAW